MTFTFRLVLQWEKAGHTFRIVNATSQLTLNYGSAPELDAYLSTKEPGDNCELKIVWQLQENDGANKKATGPITEIEIPEDEAVEDESPENALVITISGGSGSPVPGRAY